MKKRILRYLKHIIITVITLALIAVIFGLYIGASASYGENPLVRTVDKEGPYVFYKNDSIINVNYIRGNKKDGFYVDEQDYPADSTISSSCYFQIDKSTFDFNIVSSFTKPPTIYNDNAPILAISDIESGYKTFRDFLLQHKVIDKDLNWTFKNGHLVLVGDFVDRGFSTMQVLWFIYKLEQDAQKQGGHVHYIIGNHELKNLQGNYRSTSFKYLAVANILAKRQSELFSPQSFIGRWLTSKNAIELINGHLFTHGGIHPDLADSTISLVKINQIIRANYYKPYYPKSKKSIEELLISTHTGLCWYRGYFKDNLTQEEVESGLRKFNAKAIIVGHTLQSKVNRTYKGKVIGIDVKHPKDYYKSWPNTKSEGLFIENDKYYRILHDGVKIEI